jgi:hypothetical protein
MWRWAHSSASHSPSCAPWARPVAARHLLQRRSRQGAGPLLEPLPASLVAYKRSPPRRRIFSPAKALWAPLFFFPEATPSAASRRHRSLGMVLEMTSVRQS